MIELSGLVREFVLGETRIRALDQVDLKIGAGEYLSVMGPSGSGKSTLLNILGLLDRPDAGHYRLRQQATEALSEAQRAALRLSEIGFVFQSYHLVDRLSARENIELPLLLAGVAPAERQRRSAALLEQLGLAERARHRPAQLSGGQRQRVAIARAVVMGPRLLLADEPTGNLDSQSGQEVVEVLETLWQSGLTLLVVTHDPALGRRARRQLRMCDGRITQDRVADHALV